MLGTIARHFPLITRLRCELDPDDIGRREAIVASDGANVRAPVVVEEPERADDIDPNDGDRANDVADTMPDHQAIANPPKRMRVPLMIQQLPWPPSRTQHELSVVLLLLPSPNMHTRTETFSSGRVVFLVFATSPNIYVNCTTLIFNNLS